VAIDLALFGLALLVSLVRLTLDLFGSDVDAGGPGGALG